MFTEPYKLCELMATGVKLVEPVLFKGALGGSDSIHSGKFGGVQHFKITF